MEAEERSDGPQQEAKSRCGWIHSCFLQEMSLAHQKLNFDAKCGSYICVSQVKCKPKIRVPEDKRGPQTRVLKIRHRPEGRNF